MVAWRMVCITHGTYVCIIMVSVWIWCKKFKHWNMLYIRRSFQWNAFKKVYIYMKTTVKRTYVHLDFEFFCIDFFLVWTWKRIETRFQCLSNNSMTSIEPLLNKFSNPLVPKLTETYIDLEVPFNMKLINSMDHL